MSGPYFSSRDQDEYDASQMSLKSLEWQTQDHPADCDCVFCEARERREDDEPETPTMPKIETPEKGDCLPEDNVINTALKDAGRVNKTLEKNDA